jgi:hypothetical protein
MPISDLAQWISLQRRLIALLKSDPTIKNAERIMRLPGFFNVKRKPHIRCYVIEADCNRVHDLASIESRLPAPVEIPATPPSDQPRPVQCNRLEAIGRAAKYIARVPGVAKGQRNGMAYRVACILINDMELSRAEAIPLLQAWNQTNPEPLDDGELVLVAANASEYASKPRGSKLESPMRPAGSGVVIVRDVAEPPAIRRARQHAIEHRRKEACR